MSGLFGHHMIYTPYAYTLIQPNYTNQHSSHNTYTEPEIGRSIKAAVMQRQGQEHCIAGLQ